MIIDILAPSVCFRRWPGFCIGKGLIQVGVQAVCILHRLDAKCRAFEGGLLLLATGLLCPVLGVA